VIGLVVREVQEAVREWFEAMPPGMRDIPIVGVYVAEISRVLTPREIYREVMAETEIGKQIERTIIKMGIEALRGRR
jgi:hypothetical protein